MHNFKNAVARLLLAGLMFMSASVAAAPLYHVTIDTSSFGNTSAYLGLSFLGLAGATDASATVTHLAGNQVGSPATSGTISGNAPGPMVFSNAGGGADLVQAINLGGLFSFDVTFDLGTGADGTAFSWSLFDDTHYLGADGDLGSFFLAPGAAFADRVTWTPANAFSTVSEASTVVATVPEPSGIALLLLGALCLFATAHRSRLR